MTWSDLIGFCGVTAYIAAYAMLQLEKIDSKSFIYLGMNVVGSLLLITSLTFNFNLPSMMTQVLWLVFTIYGLMSAHKKRSDKVRPALLASASTADR